MAGQAAAKRPTGYDAREARRLDLNAAELGVPTERLMANAGMALAKELARHAKRGQPVLLLCGKGNNGGDGFAAAAELQAMGHEAWVVLAQPRSRIHSAAARSHFARLDKTQVTGWTGRPGKAWGQAKVIADCLLGSGL
ncbi:MAG: ADP-dependent NAD(P)H-hydrate dehydratase / NAD(P)H-hydrate epimerase, partial [Thermoplasmata archaeon]|nr:ADP-dependent NAD(P)H-hydrate dehydratase / NAD(P)H-hydrate epimerase [Thermoplasmata archaeon]